jgi:hypothetical protein
MGRKITRGGDAVEPTPDAIERIDFKANQWSITATVTIKDSQTGERHRAEISLDEVKHALSTYLKAAAARGKIKFEVPPGKRNYRVRIGSDLDPAQLITNMFPEQDSTPVAAEADEGLEP